MPLAVALSPQQEDLVHQPVRSRIFLEGSAGSGKTTTAVERMISMVERGVPADTLLVMTPQRTLAEPYFLALHGGAFRAGSLPDVLTLGGLARRMLALYWPIIAEGAGFAHPYDPPVFLTMETAQYTMARLVNPLLDQGFFDSVTIDRNRLFSQIIDNLNKAALVGFPYTEIAPRLIEAWSGETAQARIYNDAQECATRYRAYCLQHNLLDFSLQMEVFLSCLWPMPEFRQMLHRRYRHLIVDNMEEDTPVAQDLLHEWLPKLDSTMLIYDSQAGYRRFLGADPEHALLLKEQCSLCAVMDETFISSPSLFLFGQEVGLALNRRLNTIPEASPQMLQAGIQVQSTRFHPEMVAWTVGKIDQLVHQQGVAPGEIAVLSPFLSGALRFSLLRALEQAGIPARSHRPSRSLIEEPATHCLLTLACLAHPGWRMPPSRQDVAAALMQAVDGLDPIRAFLLVKEIYQDGMPGLGLHPIEQVQGKTKLRITFNTVQRYERLRKWMEAYNQGPSLELDHFLNRLFGEVLSQPGYGFHRRIDAGETAASLIESVRKFRWEMGAELEQEGRSLAIEYIQLMQEGLVAAQYLPKWRALRENAVLLSPAHTYLMANRPVSYQFWLDIGGSGWWERLHQPLTQTYVLSRSWQRGRQWTDADEFETNQENLYRLVLGLLRRCRKQVYLVVSELGEQGFEQKGPLLAVIDRIQRRCQVSMEAGNA